MADEAERWVVLALDALGWAIGKVVSEGVDHFAVDCHDRGFDGVILCAKVVVVAEHPTQASAEAGRDRAFKAEAALRPMWQMAIEHELRMRNHIFDIGRASAQPLNS